MSEQNKQDTIPKTPQQRACRHKYNECGRESNGYWFRCTYCGHKIFGTLGGKPQ